MARNMNKPVPEAKMFYPLNEPSIGTILSPVGATPSNACLRAPDTQTCNPPQETFPRNKALPPLFTPLTIRRVTFANRIFVVRNAAHLGRCLFSRWRILSISNQGANMPVQL